MLRSSPIKVSVSEGGVAFVESIHSKNFQMAERAETFHKLLFVPSGQISLEWRTEQGQIQKAEARGHLWIVPAGLRHRIIDVKPSVVLLLCLGNDYVQQEHTRPLWARLTTSVGAALDLGSQTRQVENWWRQALLEGVRGDIGFAASQQAMALQLLVMLARLETTRSHSSAERVRALRDHMQATLFERWDLERAAAEAGLSRRQFSKLFRVETGRSFVEFLTETRLDYVEHLLSRGHSTVTGAAFSAGFDDLSHFYRLFRQRTGKPPLAWLADQAIPTSPSPRSKTKR